LFSYNIKK